MGLGDEQIELTPNAGPDFVIAFEINEEIRIGQLQKHISLTIAFSKGQRFLHP